ncbi:cyclin-I [Chanos chanos]|uniref:Cyclin-I n=1 Tax=Chanos chanos TaxID=29144 RepID=A0A6J2UYT9_CHACN|nr:cyclin-I [Chanos chanos]
MKFAEPLESQKLSSLLESAVSREAKMWKVYVPKKPASQDTDITPAQRDEAVQWLTLLHSDLKLYPESLFLAVNILDRFLASVKARPKYLRCIAITCFFLAAKTNEEDERIPSLRELASRSKCGCSPSEILRMERIILDKLNWDLLTATALDFLHIFHALVMCGKSDVSGDVFGMSRSQHLCVVTQQLQRCICNSELIRMRGSVIALSLLTLELEKLCSDWLELAAHLLHKAQIDTSELVNCRELVARCLSTHQASLPPNTVYIYHSSPQNLAAQDRGRVPPWHPSPLLNASDQASSCPWDPSPATVDPTSTTLDHQPRVKSSTKRKVEQMEVDDFFDGIKRLYNEEIGQEGALLVPVDGGGQVLSCSTLVTHQEGSSSPCPPLQPVSVS